MSNGPGLGEKVLSLLTTHVDVNDYFVLKWMAALSPASRSSVVLLPLPS